MENSNEHADLRLASRAILVTSAAPRELTGELERDGARMVTCPTFEITPPDNYAALDEAIENLYGYDWLIFISPDSVNSFLQRFQQHEHQVNELDALKVCALGESTVSALEEAHVHVDVMPARLDPASVVAALRAYLDGANGLTGLNLLIPQATIGRDYLIGELEKAGARTDVVAAYRTVAESDSSLPRLRTLLMSGGIDCVVFTSATEVEEFARLFDTTDLTHLLKSTAVAVLDDEGSKTAARFGIHSTIRPDELSGQALVEAIASYLSR